MRSISRLSTGWNKSVHGMELEDPARHCNIDNKLQIMSSATFMLHSAASSPKLFAELEQEKPSCAATTPTPPQLSRRW
jgi:hypothetical protein